jgi:hypothetical protein
MFPLTLPMSCGDVAILEGARVLVYLETFVNRHDRAMRRLV